MPPGFQSRQPIRTSNTEQKTGMLTAVGILEKETGRGREVVACWLKKQQCEAWLPEVWLRALSSLRLVSCVSGFRDSHVDLTARGALVDCHVSPWKTATFSISKQYQACRESGGSILISKPGLRY